MSHLLGSAPDMPRRMHDTRLPPGLRDAIRNPPLTERIKARDDDPEPGGKEIPEPVPEIDWKFISEWPEADTELIEKLIQDINSIARLRAALEDGPGSNADYQAATELLKTAARGRKAELASVLLALHPPLPPEGQPAPAASPEGPGGKSGAAGELGGGHDMPSLREPR